MDFQVVKEKLIRGAAVGGGSFASTYAGSLMSSYLPIGGLGVSAGKVALGTGIAIGSEEFLADMGEVPTEAAEFVGYGIQGSGFAELANTFSTGANTGRVVQVRKPNAQTGADTSANQNSQQAPAQSDYSLDTA